MIRDGRIRSASLTRRRSGTSPVPSRLGWRHCMLATSRSGILSSKTSSQVTTRSREGIDAARQFSRVVLPACVPPATRMLSPATTQASRNRGGLGGERAEPDQVVEVVGADDELADVDVPVVARDVRDDDVEARAVGQRGVHERRGQVDPAARGACSIRSTRSRTSSGVRIVVVSSATPRRAMKTLVGSLIQISSTVGSSKYGCNGPNPATVSRTCLAASCRSTITGMPPCRDRSS